MFRSPFSGLNITSCSHSELAQHHQLFPNPGSALTQVLQQHLAQQIRVVLGRIQGPSQLPPTLSATNARVSAFAATQFQLCFLRRPTFLFLFHKACLLLHCLFWNSHRFSHVCNICILNRRFARDAKSSLDFWASLLLEDLYVPRCTWRKVLYIGGAVQGCDQAVAQDILDGRRVLGVRAMLIVVTPLPQVFVVFNSLSICFILFFYFCYLPQVISCREGVPWMF